MTHAATAPIGRTQDTVLDSINWPGLTLLLFGVLTLAWTFTTATGPSPIRALSGTIAASVAVIAGFAWTAVEYLRNRQRVTNR
ncbi:hypothetical protein [Nocardia jejuensis]|uniref:hypothetical protein n=1 Tax=Nocardia jejuensis TaxID=328049 RepID=UPI00082F6788|nr:hypothetical protein [Nocardia jejuensis]